MRCCFHGGPVVVLVVLVVQYFPSDGVCSKDTGQQRPQPPSMTPSLSQQFFVHNAPYSSRTLGEDARQGVSRTTEQVRRQYAGNWSAADDIEEWLDTQREGGDPSRQEQDYVPSQLYENLAQTLGTAKGVVDKAGERLSQIFGTGLLQQWKESGATAVKGAFKKLFNPEEPDVPKDATQEKLEELVKSLLQSQQYFPPSTPVDRRAQAKRPRGHEGNFDVNVLQELLRKGVAAAAASASERFAEPPTRRDGRTAEGAHSPEPETVDSATWKQLQNMASMLVTGSQGPTLSRPGDDFSVKDLQEPLASVARIVEAGATGSPKAPALGAPVGLALPLQLGLPAMHFGALSILTKESTLQNWARMVKAFERYGQADYTSDAAVDLMEKIALVLACAYKTARTLLGKDGANELIRSVIRQNAAFREQIFSSIEKNLVEGGDPSEDIALAADDDTRLRGSLSTKTMSRPAIESRLLRELLLNISKMAPQFYSQITQKYRETLDRWGVEPNELFGIVREALALNTSLKEREKN